MKKIARYSLQLGKATLCAILLWPLTTHAQQSVPKVITLVVGVAAGGVTDAVARVVGKGLSAQLESTVIVENKPGAGQIIGINILRSKPADATTLLFIAGSALGQTPAFRKDLNYEPLRDFTFIARSAVSGGVIAVSPNFEPSSVKELISYAKNNPGKLNFGSAGVGNAGHLQMEYFMSVTGTKMIHVPFKSDIQLVLELAEGRLDVSVVTAAAALPLYRDGRIKLLAVTSKAPATFLPEIPSLGQIDVAGLEGMDPFTFFGIVGPHGMSQSLVNRINQAHNIALRDPAVVTSLRENLSSEPITESPEAFKQFVVNELAKWSLLGQNLKLD